MTKSEFDARMKLVRNALGEDAAAYADELEAILTAMREDTTKDYSKEDLKAAVNEAFDKLFKESDDADVQEVQNQLRKVVTNVVEAKMKAAKQIYDATNKELPREVRNEIAAAFFANHNSKAEVKDAVEAILTKNGISGLEFARAIDYAIVNKFPNEDELYNALNVTPLDEFFYTTQDLKDKGILAKAWTSTSEGEKKIQSITTNALTIDTDYVVKRQEFTKKFLAKLAKNGKQAEFIAWITKELRQMNHATQIMALLVGDNVNDSADQVKVFETIKRSTTDPFVTVSTAAAELATLKEAREARDTVRDNGVETWAIMNRKQLTALSEYKYSGNGSIHYKSREEIAGELNVDKIYLSDVVCASNGVAIIFMQPQEYWVNRDEINEVAWPDYAHNKENWMYEELTGGRIHGLESCAVILVASESSAS